MSESSEKQENTEEPQGEAVIIRKKAGVPVAPDFFKAMMAFQYGDSAEESNAGFEKMVELAQEGKITDD